MAEASRKTLAVLSYLWDNTDERHQATTAEIIKALALDGYTIERHALPEICEELQDIGIDVVVRKSSPNKYYIGTRPLEIPEIKLLIDAIDTAKFISTTQSKNLIEKIINLAAPSSKKDLKRHVYTEGRTKSECDELFKNVDILHNAIKDGFMITFQYYEYNSQKKRVHKHGRDYFYRLSPYALVWNDDYYYVLGYCEEHQNISKFRVDRIDNLTTTDVYAKRKPSNFNPVSYLKGLFSMYDGEVKRIRLKCDSDMMKVIIDRFGKSVMTTKEEKGYFFADVDISVSRTFFGWLFGFAGKIEIASPDDVRRDYCEMAEKIISSYKNG